MKTKLLYLPFEFFKIISIKKTFTVFLLMTIFLMNAQTFTFTGNGDGTSWNDPQNWDQGNEVPYLTDNDCNVSIGSTFTVTIPNSVALLMNSGNITGPGKIVNNGTFTININNTKYFINLNFSNNGTFNLGTGTSYNNMNLSNAIVTNETAGTLVSNGIAISSDGTAGNMLNNKGLFKKLGNFDKSFSTPFTNTGTISAEVGTLTFNNTRYLETGIYNVSEGATLQTTGVGGNLKGIWSGTNNGTFLLNGNNNVSIATDTITNEIAGNGISFTTGNLYGPGEFINKTIFTIDGNNTKYFINLKFSNSGTLNLGTGAGYNNMNLSNAVVTNETVGTMVSNGIAINSDGTASNMLNNKGLFKKLGNYEKSFATPFTNTGTISAELGTLTFNNTRYLETGIYNVSEGATLQTSGVGGNLKGTWSGINNGTFLLNGNNNVSIATDTITNEIAGNGISFTTGNLYGPGEFINKTIFTIDGNNTKYFINLKFSNSGTLNLGTGAGYNNMYLSNAVVTNETDGTLVSNGIAISSDGTASNMLNNKGLFKKLGNYEKSFSTPFTNNGTISAEVGTLTFTSIFNNQTSGIVKGYSVKLPAAANLTNNGTFAPGMSPGTLTVQNFFKMDNGILEIDINGATANTQYDVLNYTGTTAPVLNGMIKVNLTYLPTVNTEYTVFNSPNVALSGTLPTSVTAYYDGYNYTFDVIKNTNNIVLKYVSATLTTSETEKEFTKIYPNPTSDFIYFKGKENVTSATIFGLEGRLLSEQKLNSNEGKVDLTNLKTGNYILILKYENSTKNYKVIKK